MALTTYAELQTTALNWSDRPDLTSEVVDCITLFEAEANRRLRVRQMETSGTVTMSSGAGSLPSDYLQWKNVKWTGTPAVNLDYADRAWLTETYPSSPSDTPRYFTIEGSTISVMPVDNTSLILRYYQKITALSSSVNWLFAAHPDIYLYGTLVELCGLTKDPEAAQVWLARRDALFREIELLHTKGKSPGRVKLMDTYTP